MFDKNKGVLPALSIVVPTYNERENIKTFIPRLSEAFRDIPHEIIVVDDSSPDGTAQEVRFLMRQFPDVMLFVRKEKSGIGGALRFGYGKAAGDIIASIDADASFFPEDLLRLYRAVNDGYDLVVGSRYSRGSFYETADLSGKVRYWAGRLENFLLRVFFGIRVTDFFSNCRAIRKTAWRTLHSISEDYIFFLEMIILAKKANVRIAELPVRFFEREWGKTKINHLFVIPLTLLKSFALFFR